MLKKQTNGASEAMDRFELKLLLKVTRGMVRKRLIENVVRVDK